MKRVFKFEKDRETDWDEGMYRWLEGYLAESTTRLPRFKKNWKVTIIVEEDRRVN